MTDSEIRLSIAELLRDAGIFYLRDENLERKFIDGTFDADLEQLGIDSLAAMELCIGLEVNWGSALVPEDLNRASRAVGAGNAATKAASPVAGRGAAVVPCI